MRTLLIIASFTPMGGCAEELGATPIRRVDIPGRVRDGSRPVAGGWIEFVPIDGTVGHLRSAPIGPDGTFQATGVGTGVHLVRLVRRDPRDLDLAFQQFTSPIRLDAETGMTMDLDLAEERLRMIRGRVAGGAR